VLQWCARCQDAEFDARQRVVVTLLRNHAGTADGLVETVETANRNQALDNST
jgi:hypothetical protein